MRKRRMNLFIEYILGCIERVLSFENMIPLEAPLIYANCDTNGVKGFSTNDLSEESVSQASLISSLPRVSKHITAPPTSPRVQASPHTSTRGAFAANDLQLANPQTFGEVGIFCGD
jgi:hypothetical protein